MTDAATIERTIVEWLLASGFKVIHHDLEWVLEEIGEEMSVTALACAIHDAITKKGNSNDQK